MTVTAGVRLDARQRRSRRALYEALDQLLAERPYADITVTDLVERASVGRQTFYRHFESIDAMLEQRLKEDMADHFAFARQLAAEGGPVFQDWVERVAADAFTRAGRQPRLYRLILGGDAGGGALRAFTTQIARMMMFAPGVSPGADPATQRFVSAYYAGAVSSFLLEWLRDPAGRTPEEMGALFARLSVAPQADAERGRATGPAADQAAGETETHAACAPPGRAGDASMNATTGE
ncbi:TetR/AcrR family transcriptional regulator [Camelimonas abortus]|uniref:TetR/AcrR family transcriptional regulator n=1 Tax=Camelimonas abortus TaxID=1017184 RepID=A0ABV7LE33_9HYPH